MFSYVSTPVGIQNGNDATGVISREAARWAESQGSSNVPLTQPAVIKKCAKGDGKDRKDDDEDDDEDDDDEDDDVDDGKEEASDQKDKSFKRHSWSKGQLDSAVTTRNRWNAENPEQQQECLNTPVQATKATSEGISEEARVELALQRYSWLGSDSSLSSVLSDEEDPFAACPASQRLTTEFRELKILDRSHPAPPANMSPGPEFLGKDHTTAFQTPYSPPPPAPSRNPQLQMEPKKRARSDVSEDVMDADPPAAITPIAKIFLKPALKYLENFDNQLGRVTRARARRAKLGEVRKAAARIKASVREGYKVPPTSEGSKEPALKRVRFAEGSKETSDHVVLDLSERAGQNRRRSE
ncbi:hypothetical protein TWF730_003686 [Orbilia blumenaviensis]|uniref:Uncharacterized protein n=1 Tax=Orbilia blumenaviensis TaxID=1796055 RepID=A0AAV9U799_9PEZI